MKKFLVFILAFAVMFVFAACGTDNGSGDGVQFQFSINCQTIADNPAAIENEAIKDLIPEDGIILDGASMAGNEGSTVMDATIAACKVLGISYDKSNGFITMLGDISGGDCGSWSGWLVKVNGEFPEVGADEIEVSEGDTVEWVYSLDGGSDVGAWME